MPFQNRVTPEGEIVAHAARGTMYGNRGGCFHRDDQTLKPQHWASRQWICCVLAFKNRRRKLLQPGLFTELFFLDEATALAAGHRPCFECRRVDAVRFAQIWKEANRLGGVPSAPAMDLMLHDERLTADRSKRTFAAPMHALADGTLIRDNGRPHLVFNGTLRLWSLDGYGPPLHTPTSRDVTVLTPPSIVAILRAGYLPMLHPSAT